MNQLTYKVPRANQKLLLAAGLIPATPMLFSTLEQFKPLESDQIKAIIKDDDPGSRDKNKVSTLPLEDAHLSGKNDFYLTIDQVFLEKHSSIRITNCKHFTISSSLPLITPAHTKKFFIEITDCEHFTIEGINCSSGRNMLFISDSSAFTIRDCQCSNAEGSGIIIHNCFNFRISDCLFNNNLSAGVLVIGHSYNGEIKNCICSRSRGFFNHDAGIHLCHTSPHITSAQIPERYHEPLPITDKTRRPHHIIIKNCTLTHCRAQGIYLEGAINCLIEDNVLLNNNKEGICFDWGSCYNIFCRNIVSLNGERRKLSPEEIRIDFISKYPLLQDGSSSMKLPGISLDNGCMNLIQENRITSNYGGGIKMIRTALFNNITNNQLLYNATGANKYVPYFHGITALGLGAVNEEFNPERRPNLDFLPSVLNSITHNTINESLQAIFYDKLSSNNFASDNVISQTVQARNRPATTWLRIKAYIKRLVSNLVQKLR